MSSELPQNYPKNYKNDINLIACDVDGTLIKESTPDLYSEMVKAIKELKKLGIIFCAASGRQYPSLRNVFHEVADDIAYIAENGAQIRYNGSDIYVTSMKREYVVSIINMLRPYYGEIETVVSTVNGSLIESKNSEFIDLIENGYHNRFTLVDDVLSDQDVVVFKISVFKKGNIRELGEKVFIPAWKDKVKVCIAGDEWADFMDKSVDKGNALKFFEDFLKIPREKTMAFGDNDNDVGMLEQAGESYAVENAVEKVKKTAKYICPGWHEKGVFKVINEKLFNNKL